jgi:tetratricopeptide (TPR) repeat protein
LVLALLAAFILSACSPQTPAAVQPTLATGALDTPQAYLARGDQHAARGDFDQAIADYSAAIQLKPDYAEAYNNRGLAYSLKGKNLMPESIADYTQAIDLRPGYAYAINNRGVAYMASGHPDDALRDFDLAIQIQPDLSQAYSNRGNYYLRLKRYDLAFTDLFRANWQLCSALAALGLALVLLLAFTINRIRRAFAGRSAGRSRMEASHG